MVEVQIINNNISLVKAISKEELLLYAKEYLKNHVYISNKNLSSTYIEEHYDLGYRDRNHIRIRKSLNSRFNQTIQLLHREGLISRYNNNNIWKRVELQESINDSNIAKSLSNDSSRISNQILQKTVINNTIQGRELKNCIGPIKLIYHQGKFINPKFYDL